MIAQRYIQLAYGIEHYFPSYIDAYSGLEEWKRVEKKSLEELGRLAQALHHDVDSVWLESQVNSMRTVIDVLRGERISYRQEIKEVYDIDVEAVPEQRFEKAIKDLDALLPGQGSLARRLESFRELFTVRPEYLHSVVDKINTELRKRTRAFFPLPEHEHFEITLVNNKPWGGYNWYLGQDKSRIDINTDLPIRLHTLPHLLAHEGYPGHHTEHVIKDKYLCVEQQKLEHSIFLINSPEAVLAEGIAESALNVIMNEDEVEQMLKELLPIAKIKATPDDVTLMQSVVRTMDVLGYVSGNAALLLYEADKSETEVLDYLETYGLGTPARARKSLEFLKSPTLRSYVFTYTVGKDLISELFKKGNIQEIFYQLLHEAFTPGMVREWIKR